MTKYYEEKKRALRLIDQLIQAGKPIQLIYYKIETQFGFGRKIVDDRVKILKEVTNYNE